MLSIKNCMLILHSNYEEITNKALQSAIKKTTKNYQKNTYVYRK